MYSEYKYLQDSSFLKIFDQQRIKEQYVKITVLNFSEKPIQDIQGRVKGGSLNLDGNSAMRRTCNLSMVVFDYENDLTNVNNLISINKKIRVEIGFNNMTNKYSEFPILWFPLGVYIIINASISHSLNSIDISLQLKDKMCLLNGECGGTLPAAVTFHEYDTIDEDGNYITVKPTIFEIIQEVVHHYGGEQLGKIIINDIELRLKQVMKWTGNNPLYIKKNIEDNTVQLIPSFDSDDNSETLEMFENGQDIGYIYTDFVFPGELIGDAGNSVCDILDIIKNTLGNYEYFYDLNGNFIFQEIKNYLNTTQATVELNNLQKENYLLDMSKGKFIYEFNNSNLVSSFSNAPQYGMIKNDFIVWGVKTDSEGKDWGIRYHLAIDKKPQVGNTYYVFFYQEDENSPKKAKCSIDINGKNNFPTPGIEGFFYRDINESSFSKDGKTLYYIYKWDGKEKTYIQSEIELKKIKPNDWRTELYLQGTMAEPLGRDSNYYYTELANEWPKLYDIENGCFYDKTLKNSSDIDFFLDFIDTTSNIAEFNIDNIGRRTKIVVDDSINCIFEPKIPDIVWLESGTAGIEFLRQECEDKKQYYVQAPSNMFKFISTGGSFNSAYALIRELLYQYTSYNESITITAIPIYHLEPNTRISVRDVESGIYGDYMIKTISIPLDISSNMTLSCIRALERI